MFNEIISNYAQLLDIHMWINALSQPNAIGLVISLVLIECLLSADNALVLSTLVKPLKEEQRKKALFYGLWGAYLFRFLLIGVGTYLINFTFIKLLGAIYLANLSIQFFRKRYLHKANGEDKHSKKANGKLTAIFGMFWGTVINVELMDIVFSVDSVLASLAISSEVWIVMLGGIIGILCMRAIATFIIKLMERVPELEITAYVLILFIALKMLLSLVHFEIPSSVFIIFVIFSFIVTFIINYMKKKKINLVEEESAL